MKESFDSKWRIAANGDDWLHRLEFGYKKVTNLDDWSWLGLAAIADEFRINLVENLGWRIGSKSRSNSNLERNLKRILNSSPLHMQSNFLLDSSRIFKDSLQILARSTTVYVGRSDSGSRHHWS